MGVLRVDIAVFLLKSCKFAVVISIKDFIFNAFVTTV